MGVVKFLSGWLDGVYHRDAHPGRVGGPITPFASVIHSTDMPPESFGFTGAASASSAVYVTDSGPVIDNNTDAAALTSANIKALLTTMGETITGWS